MKPSLPWESTTVLVTHPRVGICDSIFWIQNTYPAKNATFIATVFMEKRRSNKLPLSSRQKLLLPLTWIQGRSVFGTLVGYRLWNPRLLSILFQHPNAVVCHSWIFKCVMRTSCEVMASRLRMRQNAPADPRFWSAAQAVPYPFFAHAAWNLT